MTWKKAITSNLELFVKRQIVRALAMAGVSVGGDPGDPGLREAVAEFEKGLKHLRRASDIFLRLGMINSEQSTNVEQEASDAAATLCMLRDVDKFQTPVDAVDDTESDDPDNDAIYSTGSRSPLKPRKLTYKRLKTSDGGRRVQVKWFPKNVKEGQQDPNLLEWFKGTVKEVRKNKNDGSHLVAYDDGTMKWEKKDSLKRAKLWMFLD